MADEKKSKKDTAKHYEDLAKEQKKDGRQHPTQEKKVVPIKKKK